MISLVVVLPVIFWFIAIRLVSKSKFFWHFVISNIAIAIVGFFILTNTKLIDVGTDAYGLGTLFAIVIFGVGHSIMGMMYGIFFKMYHNR